MNAPVKQILIAVGLILSLASCGANPNAARQTQTVYAAPIELPPQTAAQMVPQMVAQMGAAGNSRAIPSQLSGINQKAVDQPQMFQQVDYIVIQKKMRLLTLWKSGQIVKTYPIMAMGANPKGHKVYEGDERTPEGLYKIEEKHISQNFQKFLGISYPNQHDRENAKKMGLSPGGHVGIHGDRGGISGFFQRFYKNWTDGCISMRNHDIEEIYALVDAGTPIMIVP